MAASLTALELQILHEIGQIIGQALNLHQALGTVLEICSRSLALKKGAITLRDEETGHYLLAASRGLTQEEKHRACRRLGEEIAGLISGPPRAFVILEGHEEPLILPEPGSRQVDKRLVSLMGVPIVLHGTPVGTMSVDRLHGDEVPLEEDFKFLAIVTELVAQLIDLNLRVQAREEKLRQENLALRIELKEKARDLLMVGKSAPVREIQQRLIQMAPSRAALLLLGESGTGKTLAARVIHELSPRARYPFLKINCASMPENLLEAELFGYEPGAAPGTARAKPGRLEEADGGSIFLNDVEEMSLNLQGKLWRYLQEQEFERLGSTRTRKVDVRIIAASTVGLQNAVAQGTFREDLAYLLSVFILRLPPLRDRREDILPLLNHFLDQVSEAYGRRFYFDQKALDVLINYGWPGNVREMENLVERLCITVEGSEIGLKDLPSYLSPGRKKTDLEDQAFLPRLKEMEKREIVAALERNHWIQSQAAMDLGLTLRQIGYRVKQFGLEKLIKEQRGQSSGPRARS